MGFSPFLIKQLYLLLVLPFSILYLTQYAARAQFDPSQFPRQERDALYALKASFNSSFLNDNWTGRQCYTDNSSRWHGIQCVSGRVSKISLESMGLNATFIHTDAFLFLTELTVLSFKNNSISGNMINFSSNIKMKQLDLSGNRLYGSIPRSLLSLQLLESLLLQDNYLKGSIPEFNQSSLRMFNVSNNDLNGSIPTTQTLQSLGPDSYSGNPQLCGSPTLNSCNNSFTTKDEADDQSNENSPPETTKKPSKPNFVTVFVVFDIIGLVAVILLFIYFKKARKLKKMTKKDDERKEEEGGDTTYGDDGLKDEEKAVKSIVEEKGKDVNSREEKGELIFIEEEARSFQLNDLLKASAEGLGTGSFGNCYKAKMDGRAAVVVKRIRDLKPLSSEELGRQLHKIAHQKHPNLLPLLAYYYSKKEKLLVYKYAENGNLYNRVHGSKGGDRIPFRWSARLSVARDIARTLEHLHINTNSQSIVPHGNLKSTNVLLDLNEKVLISDYGLSSLIAQPIAAQHLISYKSPEYQTTKKVSKKSDVWSYGCLLLELLTGKLSVYSSPPGMNGVDLCSWVNRAVREEWTAEIFDAEISVQRSASSGMLKLLQIAIRCSSKSPDNRPEMTEVVREVENIKDVESDDEDLPVDRSLTDESLSTSVSLISNDIKLSE